jgi:hypothetical protein
MRVDLICQGVIATLQVFNLKLFNLLFFYPVFGSKIENMSGRSTDNASHKELKEQIAGKAISLIIGKE